MTFYLAELFNDVRSHIVKVVRCLAEIPLQGQQKVVREHSLDDVVGRAYDVVVLMSELDLREHGLVDVECLVDDLDRLSGLLFVPDLELVKKLLVYIVGPVVDLQNMFPVFRAAGQHQGCKGNVKYLLHLILQLCLSYGCS